MALTAAKTQTTPRQALVRLSESLAKMRLSAEVTAQDVQEALRLFKVATMAAAQAGSTAGDLGSLRPETQREVHRAEDFLKRRIAVRSTVNRKKVSLDVGTTGGEGGWGVGGPQKLNRPGGNPTDTPYKYPHVYIITCWVYFGNILRCGKSGGGYMPWR